MSLPRYEQYKNSGVDWLGEIPSHWTVVPLKNIAKVVNGYPFESKHFHSTDGYPLVRIRDLGSTTSITFFNGDFVEQAAISSDDVLIGMDGDFTVGRWLGKGQALLNQRMCCIKGTTPQITRLLEYSLPTPLQAINDITYATTVKHLSSSEVEKTRVALPKDELEQQLVINFLDRETAKIDDLIAEQRRLVELLKEKRQAVISHAVTKGLNPDAPMKDSGIEWLGHVPAHWHIRRVKDVAKLESGHTPSKQIPEYWEDCNIPWVSLNDSKQLAVVDYITETAFQINELGLANSSARMLPSGAVVFTRDATIGLAAITTRPMAVSQHLIAWCPSTEVQSLFLLRVFNAMKAFLDTVTFGATIKTIGMADVKKLVTSVPPISEQSQITDFIRQETSVIDTLTQEAQTAITLLQERRSALISAAVTGKIDVRGAVPA